LLRELSEANLIPSAICRPRRNGLEAVVDRVAGRWGRARAGHRPGLKELHRRLKIESRDGCCRVSEDQGWTPWRFELSFGLPEIAGSRDPHSSKEAVVLDEGIRCGDPFDLVERAATARCAPPTTRPASLG